MERLDEFKVKVAAINVKDFGDFRRKSNTYLNRLKEQLPSGELDPIYRELKELINFHPNWEIEPTRRQILEMVERIKARQSGGVQ